MVIEDRTEFVAKIYTISKYFFQNFKIDFYFQQYLSGIIPLNKRKYEQEDATNDTKKVRILKKPSTVRSLKGLSTGF